jgi:hypothetical protein
MNFMYLSYAEMLANLHELQIFVPVLELGALQGLHMEVGPLNLLLKSPPAKISNEKYIQKNWCCGSVNIHADLRFFLSYTYIIDRYSTGTSVDFENFLLSHLY